MKHLHYLIIAVFALLKLSACNDDLNVRTGDVAEGKVRIELSRSSTLLVESRTATDKLNETIGNVAVFIFDKSHNKKDGFTLSSSENIRYIDVYLTSDDQSVYVVANHPEPQQLESSVKSLDDLKKQALTIDMPDEAHPGKYVMSGYNTVDNLKVEKKIYLDRMAAHLSFTIKVDTHISDTLGIMGGDGGDFKLSAMYLCQVPKGSFLLNNHDQTILESNEHDYIYQADPTRMRENYFNPIRMEVKEDIPGIFTASFDMFENRRGAVPDSIAYWPELKELKEHPLYKTFRQLYKRNRAMDYPKHVGEIKMENEQNKDFSNDELFQQTSVQEGQFYNATYLRIDGLYSYKDGSSYQTSYYVYLGHDNDRDFNIRRNHWYNHNITIRSLDSYDHRVTDKMLTGLTIQAPDAEESLDAHCNVVKVLLYSPEPWTASVENADETPWLEVSNSPVYKPHLLGATPTNEEAAFSISGKAGLHYFYIHTDEYIPDIDSPTENKNTRPRTGYIVCRSGDLEERIPIEQLPAQLVIFEDNYDPHTMKPVYDAFFIENKQEQKYMPWGFFHYWSYVTDDLIAAGTWDGLSNTRQLYEVGLEGDYNEILNQQLPPAYPKDQYPGGLPYDHAIGYIISKNRDRNGNGKIDYNEITWYWPAIKELQQIAEEYRQGNVKLTTPKGVYHASTPSSADPVGITPGFSYTVEMPEGKRHIEQRDRKYNVIACRRKDAWKGPQEGTGSGNVTTNPGWEEGEEIIIPRGK